MCDLYVLTVSNKCRRGGVHARSGIMGNRARWRENQRFVLEFKACLFFLNSYICHVLLENSNLRVQRNYTLNLECKEVRDQLLEKLDFPIRFL